MNLAKVTDILKIMTEEIKVKKSLFDEISNLTPQEISKLEFSREELLELLSETITEKNKIEGVMQTIDNGVFAVDWDGKMILFNKAAEKITGLKKQEVIGQYCESFLHLVDEKKETTSADAPLAEAFASGKAMTYPLCYLKSVKRKNKIPCSATYTPVKGLKEALVLGICIFKDLRKEEELERMKSDFVSMAAHELRTPLTSIRGYLAILDEELTEVDDEYKEFISRALKSAGRLDILVRNLLSVAKIERGTLPLNWQKFSPSEMVELSLEDVKEKAEEKKIKINIDVDPDVEIIEGDKDKIREVFTNFVDNAVKYTPVKGKVSIKIEKTDGMVEFSIIDSGIGLSSSDQKKLFRKFSRVNKEVMSNVKGTGLGLYISKLIVQMHHGKIGVKSAGANKGSTFYFKIPIERKIRSRR